MEDQAVLFCFGFFFLKTTELCFTFCKGAVITWTLEVVAAELFTPNRRGKLVPSQPCAVWVLMFLCGLLLSADRKIINRGTQTEPACIMMTAPLYWNDSRKKKERELGPPSHWCCKLFTRHFRLAEHRVQKGLQTWLTTPGCVLGEQHGPAATQQ